MTKFALVGDVGGTNARLALCDLASGEISRAKTYSGLDYPSWRQWCASTSRSTR
ncbi:glucokinase [Klebsiella pneumoniae]|uniref:Glucokinase n=1 Tax=Klebsiella pneumoniae TaxID=573 RepID=A0A4P0YBU3_KLEPN|nr:glucokinase [Klebsiella pneumoniae]